MQIISLGDEEDDSDRRNSRHMDSEEAPLTKKERNKVIETEDASRGPLSGCIRLADSSRVIQRLKVRKYSFKSPEKVSGCLADSLPSDEG